jgi:hypothetical protein
MGLRDKFQKVLEQAQPYIEVGKMAVAEAAATAAVLAQVAKEKGQEKLNELTGKSAANDDVAVAPGNEQEAYERAVRQAKLIQELQQWVSGLSPKTEEELAEIGKAANSIVEALNEATDESLDKAEALIKAQVEKTAAAEATTSAPAKPAVKKPARPRNSAATEPATPAKPKRKRAPKAQ